MPECPVTKTVDKEPREEIDCARVRIIGQHNHPTGEKARDGLCAEEATAASSGKSLLPKPEDDQTETRTKQDVQSPPLSSQLHLARELYLVLDGHLETVRRTLSFAACQLWVPNMQQTLLQCMHTTCSNSAQDQEFLKKVEMLHLSVTKSSTSLPALAWMNKCPEVNADLSSAPCELHDLATSMGMLSAMAFPVTIEKRPIAILCVLCTKTDLWSQVQESTVAFMSSSAVALAQALVVTFSRLCDKSDEQTKKVLQVMLHHSRNVWQKQQTGPQGAEQ